MREWWCCNCKLRVNLTVHGRCEKCGTLAVQYDLRERKPTTAQAEANA